MSLLLALTGSGGGGNAQFIAFTLDGIAVSVNQTDGHLQTAAFTLGDIAIASTQVLQHPQTVAYTLGDVTVAASQANTGQAAGNSQTIAFTLDSVSIAGNQTAQHAQSGSLTLGDIASNSAQVANHPHARAITLDSVQVASNQSIGSAPKTQTVSIGLDSVGVSAQQIGPPDRMIQVIVGNQQRMRKTYEEEKRKTEEFLTITEVAKPRKAGTITLSQLVGKNAANQINQLDIEERIQKITRAKRRQQDDDLMLMM